MKSDMRAKLDDVDYGSRLIHDISVSKLSDSLKVRLLEFLVAKDNKLKAKQLAEIAYSFFNAEKSLDEAACAKDIKEWKDNLLGSLSPSVRGFEENEVESLLALLVHEHYLNHKAYEPIYLNYMEYLGEKRHLL